jgi:hypothetical protein
MAGPSGPGVKQAVVRPLRAEQPLTTVALCRTAVPRGQPAEWRPARRRKLGAHLQQAEPAPKLARARIPRAAAPEAQERRGRRTAQGAAVMSQRAAAGPPAGARCWRSAQSWPQSFGALSATTTSRRSTIIVVLPAPYGTTQKRDCETTLRAVPCRLAQICVRRVYSQAPNKSEPPSPARSTL